MYKYITKDFMLRGCLVQTHCVTIQLLYKKVFTLIIKRDARKTNVCIMCIVLTGHSLIHEHC
jgi:hypothetical protein